MNPFTWIKNQSLFKDRQSVWLLIFSFLLLIWNLYFMLSYIESREHKVFVRYSGYFEGSLSDRGEWYSLYVLPAFVVIVFAFTLAISLKLHKLRPELAKALIALNLVVGVFAFLVARSLLNLL